MFARRAVAYFPDESVVIKMKKTRCRNHTGEHTLHRLDFEAGIEIREGTVGKNKPDVQPNQRTAPAENEAHEAADRAIFFNATAIVNPDQREILHIVKNLEQRDPGQNVGDAVIAIPPESDGRGQQRQLHRIGTFPFRPHPGKIEQEQNGYCNGDGQDDLLRVVQEPGLNE